VNFAFFAGCAWLVHVLHCVLFWDVEIRCIVEFGVVLWTVSVLRVSSPKPKSCYICNYTSAAFHSGYNSSMPRTVFSAFVCVTVRQVSLWKFGFYCECYVCNACVECNLNHFIVYLIVYANLCCVCSARWWSVMPWGARPPTEIEQGFFSDFPWMRSGMFVILCNAIFSYCNFNRYVCVYIYVFSHVVRTSKHF